MMAFLQSTDFFRCKFGYLLKAVHAVGEITGLGAYNMKQPLAAFFFFILLYSSSIGTMRNIKLIRKGMLKQLLIFMIIY